MPEIELTRKETEGILLHDDKWNENKIFLSNHEKLKKGGTVRLGMMGFPAKVKEVKEAKIIVLENERNSGGTWDSYVVVPTKREGK